MDRRFLPKPERLERIAIWVSDEYANWRDTGCDAAPSCLRCPLPCCVHDDPEPRQVRRRRERDARIIELRRAGLAADEVARRLGVAERTVWRALRRARQAGPPASPARSV